VSLHGNCACDVRQTETDLAFCSTRFAPPTEPHAGLFLPNTACIMLHCELRFVGWSRAAGPTCFDGRCCSRDSAAEFPLLRTALDLDDKPIEDLALDGGKNSRLWELMATYLSSDTHSIQRSIANHVELTLAASRFNFDMSKCYRATAHS
jgi:hypothetical protein